MALGGAAGECVALELMLEQAVASDTGTAFHRERVITALGGPAGGRREPRGVGAH